MRSFLLILSFSMSMLAFSQGLNLKECIVIGQFDKPEDRYAMEVTLCEILNTLSIKAVPSSNFVKQGGNSIILASDSSMQALKAKNLNTYCLINVKGYDKRFKKSEILPSFSEGLERATLYNLYKDEIASVSFEFIFYRDAKPVFNDVLKIGNIGNRDDVIKRLKKKAPKHIQEHWGI
ncbi:MAG: hypothetical protein ACO28O_02360 [Crocinitomicaceae bacterium]